MLRDNLKTRQERQSRAGQLIEVCLSGLPALAYKALQRAAVAHPREQQYCSALGRSPTLVVSRTPSRSAHRGLSLRLASARVQSANVQQSLILGSNSKSGQFRYCCWNHSIQLLQDDDARPDIGHFCEWMPYQLGQAAKAAQALPENSFSPDRRTLNGLSAMD
jgi:hypothetical protein